MMAPVAVSLIVPLASSLMQPVDSLLINVISGKGVMRAGKRQEGRILPFLALPLMIKVLEIGVTRNVKLCNNMDHIDKNF